MGGFVTNIQAAHEHGAVQGLIEHFFEHLFHWEEGSPGLEMVSHFTYDLIRTFLIFLLVLAVVSYVKTYIPVSKVQGTLTRVNRYVAVVLAALAGVLSSTCVCTNVPLFLGFLAFGVPLHLATTYLISASLINITSLLSMAALTDLRFTATYVCVSLLVTIVAGIVLSFLHEEAYINRDSLSMDSYLSEERMSQSRRLHFVRHEMLHTLREQWGYIVIGVALAAAINAFVNLEFVEQFSRYGFLSIFVVTVVGLVLHTDVISVLPIVSSLLQLNVSYGLLFALISSQAFFAIPMVVMVKKTVKMKYIGILWGVMFVLILAASEILFLVGV